jgi:hypothetical protein
MTRKLLIGLVGALALAAAPLAASATTYTLGIQGSGIDGGNGCTGTTGACPNGTNSNRRFDYAPPGGGFNAAGGDIEIDNVGLTLDLDIDVASFVFTDYNNVPTNGVDEIVFTNVNYAGTLNYTISGTGAVIVSAAQTITVSGFYEEKFGGGSVGGPTAFSVPATVASGTCGAPAVNGSATQCGFIFGPGGGYILSIGTTTPQNLRFKNVLNVVVPEPASIGLVVIGLGGLALAGRRRAA